MHLGRIVICSSLALAACNTPPAIVNPAPVGITERVSNGNWGEADTRARQYCGGYGKQARRESVNQGAHDALPYYACD